MAPRRSRLTEVNLFAIFLIVFSFTIQDTKSSWAPYGSEASVKDYSYVAALEKCGAGILSERWVVSAAHCVNNPSFVKGKYVWVLEVNNSIPLKYDRIVIHPEYQIFQPINIPINDIALLRLEEPLQLSDGTRLLKLPKEYASTELTHVFVGEEQDKKGAISRVLKKADLIKLTSQQCISDLPLLHRYYIQRYLPTLERAIICTKRADNKPGVCKGDSGSPLVKNDVIIGLGSHIGSGNCNEIRLVLFTNVFTYMPWIRSVTNLK